MTEEHGELNEPVRVFLSYHHSDGIIASTLRKALKEISRTRVKCFLHSHEIKSGRAWEAELGKAIGAKVATETKLSCYYADWFEADAEPYHF